MQARRVGTTGLEVSELALGTMTWSRDTDADEAGEQLDLFIDAGGTLIDTAASYADGGAEALLGSLLNGTFARSDVQIVTKAGIRRTPQGGVVDASRETLLDTLDASEIHRRQSRAENALAQVQDADHDAARRSAAATMRGVLLYEDALSTGSRSTDLLPRSVAALRRAIELDPSNADAKLNLEQVLNLQPPRQQRDRAGGGGGSTGGASYSGPGEGY